jgi:dUTP pyrophosphatase
VEVLQVLSALPLQIKVLDRRLLDEFGGLPVPATAGASAVDVVACSLYPTLPDGKPDIAGRRALREPIRVSGSRATYVGLGFALAGPPGWAAVLIPRSGLGSARGLGLANTIGFIDVADYRGECIAALWNRTDEPVEVRPGDRVAQMFLVQTPAPEWTLVEALPPSARAAGGFGSTG